MVYIDIGSSQPRQLSFYLAAEEYVARHVDADDCFFMWQVEPSVIFGRNQLIENEVNVAYCREHGIRMYRRKSGGGCVYADMSNVMFSYITREENVNFTFNRYMNMLVLVLYRMGIEAKATGRNDLLIDGRKVSGNAFYHLPGRSIVHGTMLFDTNMEHMLNAITPSREKLTSKGVESVRSHITTLSEHLTMDIDAFKRYVRETLCDGEISLTADDVTEIERLTLPYLEPAFLWGNDPRSEIALGGRIEGVGSIHINVQLQHGVIHDLHLSGDFLPVCEDAGNAMLDRLRGSKLDSNDLQTALTGSDAGQWIMNLTNEQLIYLLTNKTCARPTS